MPSGLLSYHTEIQFYVHSKQIYLLHKNYNSLEKKSLCLTDNFSYFINKHLGITLDMAMIKCSENLLQLYNEKNHSGYSIQTVGKKPTKLIVNNNTINSE